MAYPLARGLPGGLLMLWLWLAPVTLPASAAASPGTVVAWGQNNSGQSTVPAGLSGVTAVAAGSIHTVALKSDSTVLAWGDNYQGQTNTPAGLNGVIAIGAGGGHTVALKNDGTVVAWGYNYNGQISIPAGLNGVIAIGAGGYHTVALKSNGTVVAWGDNTYGQITIPAGLSGVIAVAGGGFHTVALKNDGTVVAWGQNVYGQTAVPAGLGGVTAIAAGSGHTVALKNDGTLVAWGAGATTNTGFLNKGQSIIPVGLSGVTAISAGQAHTVALKNNGTVVAWGDNSYGQTTVPAGLSGVTAIAAGSYHTVTVGVAPPNITAQPQSLAVNLTSNAAFSVSAVGTTPFSYRWQFNASNISGATNATYGITNVQPASAGSYSVVVTNIAGSVTSSNALLRLSLLPVLGNLSQTFDGTAKSITVGTTPPGLSVSVTYNGSAIAPVNAGTYAVIGTINDPLYFGSVTNTLVVSKGVAGVVLGNLFQAYDGAAKHASAGTVPAGLTVSFTYNSSATAPVSVGSYTVIGTVNDPNYQGHATDLLTVAPSLTIVSSLAGTNGQIGLQISGPSDRVCVIEVATSLSTGTNVVVWQAISTNTLTEGLLAFARAKATNAGNQFFRVVIMPPQILEMASAMISAAPGGTLTLPSGSSMSIPAGALAGDQIVTLKLLSDQPLQPPSGIISSVGPTLSATFNAQPAANATIQFVLKYGANAIPQIRRGSLSEQAVSGAGPAPIGAVVDLSGGSTFVGIPGAFDVVNNNTTFSVNSDLAAHGKTINLSLGDLSQAAMSAPPPPSGGLIWDPVSQSWASLTNQQLDPAKKTLVLVHGFFSSVEKAFGPCLQAIMDAGGYQQVVGFDYDTMDLGGVQANGQQLAAFINSLGLPQVDVMAHSKGGAVSLAAGCGTSVNIGHMILLGSPLEGSPIADSVQAKLTLLMNLPTNPVNIVQRIKSTSIGLFLNTPWAQDFQTTGTTMSNLRSCFDSTHPASATKLILAAGGNPTGSPVLLEQLAGTAMGWLKIFNGPFDMLVPQSSALATSWQRANKTTQSFPNLSHTQLECDPNVIAFLSTNLDRTAALYTLSVTTAGTGTGTVTASPTGLSYTNGTVVTLTASPATGSTFGGWSGDASASTLSTQVTMNANKSVTATFNGTNSATPSISITSAVSTIVDQSSLYTDFSVTVKGTTTGTPSNYTYGAGWGIYGPINRTLTSTPENWSFTFTYTLFGTGASVTIPIWADEYDASQKVVASAVSSITLRD